MQRIAVAMPVWTEAAMPGLLSWRARAVHIALAQPRPLGRGEMEGSRALCGKAVSSRIELPPDWKPSCKTCERVAARRGLELPSRTDYPPELYIKDEAAFLRGEGICYRPVNASWDMPHGYTRDDFLIRCNEDEGEALALFRGCVGEQLDGSSGSRCAACSRFLPWKLLVKDYDLPGRGGKHYYCRRCFPAVKEAYTCTCETCGTTFYRRYSARFCPKCKSVRSDMAAEAALVSNHLARARELGLPATLTPDEWHLTKEYFEYLCAYCQSHPYEFLEHFLPLSQGGGTTMQNCVPTCASCNSRKRGLPLDELPRVMPQEWIDRVLAYSNLTAAEVAAAASAQQQSSADPA